MDTQFDFELLASDTLKVLKILYDRAITLEEENVLYCRLSQVEIVNISHFCKSKINQTIITLKKEGYLEQSNYCKYIITEKTKNLFKLLNSSH